MNAKLKSNLLIVLGAFMVAIAVYFFLTPTNMTIGGATGIAIVLSYLLHLPMSYVLFATNIVLFALGFLFIGNKFGIKTVLTSLGISFIIFILEKIIPLDGPIVDDMLLQMIIAVIVSAVGMAIILNQYASIGGTDILSKIINKFTGLDLGKGVLLCDLVITLFVGIVFGLEIGLYSLLGIMMNGLIIDYTIDGLNTSKNIIINSEDPELVKNYIVKDLNHSANLYKAVGAYTGEERTVIMTVCSRRDYLLLKRFIQKNAPNSFLVVMNASEVYGFRWRNILDW